MMAGGACFYQHTDKAFPNEDEGKFFFLSKKPKRIIAWVLVSVDHLREEKPPHIL